MKAGMRPALRFIPGALLIAGIVAAALAAAATLLWAELDATHRAQLADWLAPRAPLLVLLALAAAGLLALAMAWLRERLAAPARRMAEAVRVMHASHAAHRATPEGPAEMQALAQAVNALAQAHQAARDDVAEQLARAGAQLAQERNRLAALMSELAQSVVVCNADGRILLYNPHATALLGGAVPLGLGRSLAEVLGTPLARHALDRVRGRLARGDGAPVAHLVASLGERLLRVQVAPVRDVQGEFAGVVLILQDITQAVASDSRRELLLRRLTQGSRAALASIRAAAETLQQYPDMEAAQRERFVHVVQEEAQRLSDALADAQHAQEEAPLSPWPMEDMLARDLAHALARNIAASLAATPASDTPAAAAAASVEDIWLRVDSYALVQALTQLAGRVVTELAAPAPAVAVQAHDRHVRLVLRWPGAELPPDRLHEWEQLPLRMTPEGGTTSLQAVLERHGAEIWSQAASDLPGAHDICIALPRAADAPDNPPAAASPPATQERPIYYDFDLFQQPGQTPEWERRPLANLNCTVFDTETTGLSPSEGDEIISIGAVRIVNGRLLHHERFDRLIRPGRPVRAASVAIHGLDDAALAGQPDIAQVLPRFHRFAHDTVLVAHNAAFDMRFLQLARASTGVAFDQPVLDTLLLSALVHPGLPDAEHRLEAMAQRMGIEVVGRHTALGDALVTAEVFLRLLPLLADQGIVTLGQALEASRRTRYASLGY